MAKSRKSSKFDAEGFIKGLRSLLDTLPSESQKQEINDALAELIRFFAELQNSFRSMPSVEDADQLSQSLQKLEALVTSVEKIPAISVAFGIDEESTKKSVSSRSTNKNIIDVKEVLASLANSSGDEIREQLAEKKYKRDILRDIISEMGNKAPGSATIRDLVDKIATDIVNQRLRSGVASVANQSLGKLT
jgi:hypothetical protein